MLGLNCAGKEPHPNEIAQDVALIRLDARVPATLARPRHIPREVDICGADGDFDGFVATTIGFGHIWHDGGPCPFVGGPERRYSTHDGWYGFEQPSGGVYSKRFFNSLNLCGEYSGVVKVDSGGTFLDAADQLCGVVSSYAGPFPDPLVPFALDTINYMATLDTGPTISWLENTKLPDGRGLIDINGNYEGECPAYNALCDFHGKCPDNDMDSDGIVDVCDLCPDVYDPDQTRIHVDQDNDGFDDLACDYCPGLTLTNQTANRNYETELAIEYPGLSAPPVIDVKSTDLAGFIDKRLHAFKPDACDPTPVPVTTLEDVDAALPDGSGAGALPAELPPIVHCAPQPGGQACNCPLPDACSWYLDPTGISTVVTRSDGGPAQGTPTTLGYRYCGCLTTTTSLKERVACEANGCFVGGDFYDAPTSSWKPISTEEAGPWVSKQAGAEFTANVASTTVKKKWDFLDLGFRPTADGLILAYDGNGDPLPNGGPTATEYQLFGLLWSTVREVSGVSTAHIRSHAGTYQSGDVFGFIEHHGPTLPKPAPNGWPIKGFCPTCPEFTSRYRTVADDPYLYRAGIGGVERVTPIQPSIRDLYASIAVGSLRYVEAAEPLSVLATLTAPGSKMLNGVALDSTVTVAQMFESDALGDFPSSRPRISIEGTPDIQGNEGVVLSSIARRVFVLGGTTNGQAHGWPHDLGWSLDIDTNLWSSFPLSPMARPRHVLGATFLLDDANVYVIDRARLRKAKLRRWLPGLDPETLGTLPGAWKKYDRSWLVAGPHGQLLFAATRSGGSKKTRSLFARFSLDAGGQLSFVGRAFGEDVLIAEPVITNTGVSIIVEHPSGGRLASIPSSAFEPGPPGQRPKLPDAGADDAEAD